MNALRPLVSKLDAAFDATQPSAFEQTAREIYASARSAIGELRFLAGRQSKAHPLTEEMRVLYAEIADEIEEEATLRLQTLSGTGGWR